MHDIHADSGGEVAGNQKQKLQGKLSGYLASYLGYIYIMADEEEFA